MQCFRVGGEYRIPTKNRDGSVGAIITHHIEGLLVGLDSDHEPCVSIGSGFRHAVDIPLSDNHKDLVEEAGWRTIMDIPPLKDAGISREGGRLSIVNPDPGHLKRRKMKEDVIALVHVEPNPGIDGRAIYSASSFDEERTEEGRMKRVYREFPPPGIEKLVEGGLEPELLVKMLPGSSFRIICTGDTSGGPDGMTVIWTGKEMLVHPRHRRRKTRH